MNKKMCFFLTILFFGGLFVSVAPYPVTAIVTGPPTLGCTLNLKGDQVTYSQYSLHNGIGDISPGNVAISPYDGSLIMGYSAQHQNKAGANFGMDTKLVSISRNNCSTNWTNDCLAAVDARCIPAGLAIGQDHDLGYLSITTPNALTTIANVKFKHVNLNTGAVFNGINTPDVTSAFSTTTISNVLPRKADMFNNAGTENYVYSCGTTVCGSGSTGKIVVINDGGIIASDTTSAFALNIQDYESPNNLAYALSASDTTIKKWELTGTPSILASATGDNVGNANLMAPIKSQAEFGKAYILKSSGTCGTSGIGTIVKIDTATWTETTVNVATNTGNCRIYPVYDFDKLDNILACGNDSGTTMAAVKIVNGASPVQNWSMDISQTTIPGSQASVHLINCQLDYFGGFWVVQQYQTTAACAGCTAIYIRHYNGGGFTQPAFIKPNGVNKFTDIYNSQLTVTDGANGDFIGNVSKGNGTEGPFGNFIKSWDNIFPTHRIGAVWWFGIIVTMIFVAIIYKQTQSPLAIPFGAFIGVIIAMGLGMLPIWFVYGIVFLLIIIVVKLGFSGGGGEE